ncbi:S8 family serine peptidase [uncultured Piscinibacter sp.]|uniref:S8 family serine peptidase n=1 Tax=uncultured Piscinibacter sp. TaxID=1131835 RepID=UPI002638B634|nr:S8 family serine peptidase [uncultured Piscinibacter sp.]
MIRKSLFALVGVTAAMAVSMSSAVAQGSRYVVMYKQAAVPAAAAQQIAAVGGNLVASLPKVGIAIVSSDRPDFIAAAARMTGVAGVDHDVPWTLPAVVAQAPLEGPTAADDLYNGGLVWGVQRVGAPAAWAAGRTGSHSTVVAVIDTGIAWNHPDLAPNVVYADCYTSAGSFADGACNPYPAYSDHGTHVAGTIAAAFGGGRVVGVGPNLGLAGYNTFEPVPGCGVCAYSSSRWMAMLDAAARGFQVISMSLGRVGQYGGQGTSDLATFVAAEKRVANAVLKMGTAMVASAGNEGLDVNGTLVHVPGDIPGIINVAATGIQPNPRYQPGVSVDIQAFYSNQGAAVTLSAPGGDCGQIGTCDANRPANWAEYLVLSTIVSPNPFCAATASCAVGYGWKGGTSMATPHVSAAAGLMFDVNPSLNANAVASILKDTAESLGDRQVFGQGMLNVPAAVAASMP